MTSWFFLLYGPDTMQCLRQTGSKLHNISIFLRFHLLDKIPLKRKMSTRFEDEDEALFWFHVCAQRALLLHVVFIKKRYSYSEHFCSF